MTAGSIGIDMFRFSHRLRVRWGECDMQGIVFNPRYMEYVDVAMTEYWRAIGLPYPAAFLAQGADSFMVAASQSYRASARFDDELDICLRTETLGTTSLTIACEIRRDGARLFAASAIYVMADAATQTKMALLPGLVQAILAYEHTPPLRKVPAA